MVNMKLKIADDLTLPIEAVTETLGFLGRRGSGKSYAATKLAEEMHRADAQFVALDPVGIWYGLRLAADGKAPGLPVPVLGGLHGDIPLEAGAGALIADLVVDRGASVILDVSQFESDADKARFARAFADRFFFRKKSKPSAVHVFLEECQEFIPQNPQREEAHMLHAFTRMAKIGRNFGIGMSLISQRPQEVNKKVLNLTELLFAFQLTGPQERKTLQGWIADKGIDEDIEGVLPKLERGCPHVWSPAWLKISKVVGIAPKHTFDASSTPKVGKDAAARELSPIDLEQLRADMAATIERAKAEDPKALRAENARLRAELAKKPTNVSEKKYTAPTKPAGPRREDVATINALRKALEEAMKVIVKINAQDFSKNLDGVDHAEIEKALAGAAQSIAKMVERHLSKRESELDGLRREAQRVAARLKNLLEHGEELTVSVDVRKNEPFTVSPAPLAASAPRPPHKPVEGISRSQQKILDALAWLETAGIAQPVRAQLALWAGVSPTSGGFFNNLGSLRTAGLIDYPSGGTVALTDAGRAAAQASAPPTVEEMQSSVCAKVGNSKAAILRALIDIYPKDIARDDLAQRIDVSPTSGGFFNNLGSLRTLGVIDYPGPGRVAALPVLFLE